jgi:uncharacterized Rossmann fold enzyme
MERSGSIITATGESGMSGTGTPYRIEKTKDGADTIIVLRDSNRYPLHSTVNPSREANSLEGRFDPGKYDLLIMLGTGLGYHLLPLRDLLPSYRRVILIDVLSSLEEAITGNPLTGFLTRSGIVSFITGLPAEEAAREASGMIDLESARGVTVMEHPASIRIFPEYYGLVRELLRKTIEKSAGNLATRKHFGMRYMKNALANLPDLPGAYPVSALRGAIEGHPAAVIASGPSAERHLPTIRERQEEMVIIAVDSALPLLLCHGIIPDVTMIIDPQPFVEEHLLETDRVTRLTVCSMTSRRITPPPRLRFCSMNSHPLSQLVDKITGGAIGSIDSSTGTVAGDALSCALSMGASAVAMVGFDFSFPGHTIYSRGTAYQRRYSLYFQNRLLPVESQNMAYIMRSSRGHRVSGRFTRKSLEGYRDSLSSFARGCGKGNLFSINGMGLPVDGIPEVAAGDFTVTWCRGKVPKSDLVGAALAGARTIASLLDMEELRAMLGDRRLVLALLEESLGTSTGAEAERAMRLIRAVT